MNDSVVKVSVLDYPGAMQSSVQGFAELFTLANQFCRDQGLGKEFQVSQCRREDVEIAMQSRVRKSVQVIVIPSGIDDKYLRSPDRFLIKWIQKHHARGAIICSACAGAFVIGATGLLDNRVATTHWHLAPDFVAQFPNVKLDINKILVNDGDVITAGGLMSWIDLGLELVAQFCSVNIMRQLGKYLVVDTGHREQRYYRSFSPNFDHGDQTILKVQHHIQSHFKDNLSISTLCSICHLSERTFLRRFIRATGLKPTQYLQSIRVQKACELIESSKSTFESIAINVGYEDVSAFRKVFQRIVGLTPRDFRGRFARV